VRTVERDVFLAIGFVEENHVVTHSPYVSADCGKRHVMRY
jgi:hypothetical protein